MIHENILIDATGKLLQCCQIEFVIKNRTPQNNLIYSKTIMTIEWSD